MQITIDSTSVLDYRFYLPIPGSWLLKHPFPSLLFYTDEKQSPLSPAIINITKRICNKINTCLQTSGYEATGFGYGKSCLSMRCTPTKPMQYSLLISSEWNEQIDVEGRLCPAETFSKKRCKVITSFLSIKVTMLISLIERRVGNKQLLVGSSFS